MEPAHTTRKHQGSTKAYLALDERGADHAPSSGSRAGIAGVYQRHDWAAEKRAALDAWAAHVLAVAEGRSPTGNVVKLGRAG